MQHLKDFVWMQRGNEPPVQVTGGPAAYTQKLAEGYLQVDPPVETEE